MAEERKTVVLDNGSLYIRAGFAGEQEHQCEMLNIVGRAKQQQARQQQTVPASADDQQTAESSYVGGEALSTGLDLQHDYPVKRGIITNWDDAQTIWGYIFEKELEIADNTGEHAILVTDPLLDQLSNRKKLAEVLFEVFAFPALYIARQAVMSMYSTGETTGLLLQSGDGVTEVMAMVECFMVPESVQRFNLAGADMTQYLGEKLAQQGHHSFNRSTDAELLRSIKERLCFLTHSGLKPPEGEDEEPSVFQLPDGETLQMSQADCAGVFEAMFHPELLTGESDGVQNTIHTAVNKSDIDSRKKLWSNIILSGGNTMVRGFAERLKDELRPLVPSTVTINVKSPEQRQFSAWKGASMMASLPSFQQLLISKAEYDELGMDIVKRKCF